MNWIVKLHPANVWKRKRDRLRASSTSTSPIREHIGELPPHVELLDPDTDISTWSLFDVTDYGVTIRGSIGFELPCFGMPALTAGTGFYSGRGFTVDSETADEYLGRLVRIQSSQPPNAASVELARNSTRMHCSGCARRGSRASAPSSSRWRRSTTRPRRRSS